MTFLDDLRSGRHGVHLEMPQHMIVQSDKDFMATLKDEVGGVTWFLFYFPDLHMVLTPRYNDQLRRAMEWHARFMFKDMFKTPTSEHAQHPTALASNQPRTSDPSWSPMVEMEDLEIGGTPALHTIHRMQYQPGSEIMMGHLLIPLRHGLFEVRTLSIDQMTGYRESAHMTKILAKLDHVPTPEELQELVRGVRQADLDNPDYDSQFPQHSLARTRAAFRWMRAKSNLRITEPAKPPAEGEFEIPLLGCALKVPARMVLSKNADVNRPSATFARVSFCGTDGIEHFLLSRPPAPPIKETKTLREHALVLCTALTKAAQLKDVQLHVEELPPIENRPQVQILVEGLGPQGRMHNAYRGFADDDGRMWLLSRFSTAAVPLTELTAELAAAARTWRPVAVPQPAKQPWWKFW